ncbi:DUF2332 domain-containing protein [Micromonospora sp. U21]|uniref:DUF2332 domain-containing protein n=1 Tax=Micromonospora sp. U21 TaxID=2824899 RepID=UPI001B37B80D|nr:DUF2332 domain-containing protein [Micromonospora sp. U21]MBQ0905246.1 DUF2332 domain-containing protein [Micromonospora sp. U21]
MTRAEELTKLAEHFRQSGGTFKASPLYRALCEVIADDERTLELLVHRRPGQQPSFLLFGAAHHLLLSGVQHDLGDFYPSVVGTPARDPAAAGPVFLDFCRSHGEQVEELIGTRLVQSNVVRRVLALRFALAALRDVVDGPMHLVEVGASAGFHLHVDRYRYRLGGRVFGAPDARVTVESEWRGDGPAPDLTHLPEIGSRTGVDLHPVDVLDPDQRRWLRALVWPEDRPAAGLLDAALKQAVAEPVRIIAGDAVDVCPDLGRQLPTGEARLVFHSATRMHVPAERRAAFDKAVDSIGDGGPLYHLWLEPAFAPHHGEGAEEGCLAWHGPETTRPVSLVRVDGHLRWMAPLDGRP